MEFFNGAVGALTFGIYYQIQTDRTITLHNQKLAKIMEDYKKEVSSLINVQSRYRKWHLV